MWVPTGCGMCVGGGGVTEYWCRPWDRNPERGVIPEELLNCFMTQEHYGDLRSVISVPRPSIQGSLSCGFMRHRRLEPRLREAQMLEPWARKAHVCSSHLHVRAGAVCMWEGPCCERESEILSLFRQGRLSFLGDPSAGLTLPEARSAVGTIAAPCGKSANSGPRRPRQAAPAV